MSVGLGSLSWIIERSLDTVGLATRWGLADSKPGDIGMSKGAPPLEEETRIAAALLTPKLSICLLSTVGVDWTSTFDDFCRFAFDNAPFSIKELTLLFLETFLPRF